MEPGANKPPQFTPELRETFCTYIARYYVERNKCVTVTDFRNVTSQMVEYFPEENAVSLYLIINIINSRIK